MEHKIVSLVDPLARETVEVSIKYGEQLEAQRRSVERVRRSAGRVLPADWNYHAMRSLSAEEAQKLSAVRPRTLKEASDISGITPSALAALVVALRKSDALQRDKQAPKTISISQASERTLEGRD